MAKVNLRTYNRDIETMIDRGQLDEAIAHCQHILKTFPKHLETYRLLGKAYLEYKRYKDAVDIFMRVLASEPNDFVSNVGMSIIRDEENKLDDAIWHMERAFEIQPSNPAIQSELQRLYGRRDGVQPPRIRMTRGALAHMYVQGELYPQAISEIKSVLKDDQGRNDMQVLLARAYYRSGQKNDAADTAMSVLHRYPYCLDANRVLVEILSVDRPDKVPTYRQRVYELDPYATQVTGTVFQSGDVSDNAVTLERLDWNGQPARGASDWGNARAIAPDSGFGRATPANSDWGTPAATASFTPPPAQPEPASTFPASNPSFDFNAPSVPASTVPTNEDNIPDFMRAAGWGTSTGAFDESKSSFADEPAASPDAAAIEQADLPDWVKAMMPQDAAAQPEPMAAKAAQPAEEEDLPDWIKNIGAGTVSAVAGAAAVEQPDWLKPEDAQPVAASETPDWMAGLEPVASSDQPDWLKELDTPEPPSAPPADQPDWMRGLAPAASAPDGQTDWMAGLETPAATDEPDWLKGVDAAPASAQPDWMQELEQPVPEPASDQPDWLKGLDETPATAAPDATMEWLKGLDQAEEPAPAVDAQPPAWMQEPAPAAAASTDLPDWLTGEDEPESNDRPAWLKGVETTPEPAAEIPASALEQPDWLTQFGEPPAASTAQSAEVSTGFDFLDETPAPEVETPAAPVADLGTSQTEIDDSLAWLEGLAAKQGATEGLLVKPEDRKQEEPDWVKKIKGEQAAPVAETPTPVVEAPAAPVADLGTSQTEIDDSLAWLEGLAAKQGATEGLLVKPEDRKQEEPDWVKKIKGEQVAAPVAETPAPEVEAPAAPVADLGTSQTEIDDSLAWLEGLAAKQGATEGLLVKPEDRKQEEPDWVKKIKGEQAAPVAETPTPVVEAPATPVADLGTSQTEIDDSLAWLEGLAAKQGATEGLLVKPEDRKQEEPDWVKKIKGEQAAPVAETPTPVVETPAAPVADLSTSQTEIDDSLAWLEGLAAKHGATEGLLVKPEDRKQEEPDWVKKIKGEQAAPVVETPAPVVETPVTPVADLGTSQTEIDDSLAWLEGLAAKQGATEGLLVKPEDRKQEEPDWVKQAKAAPVEPVAPAPEPASDTATWLRGLEADEEQAEPVMAADETKMWLKSLDADVEPEPVAPVAADDDLPGWLQGLAAEEQAPVSEAVTPVVGADDSDWLNDLEEHVPAVPSAPADETIPGWLKGLDEEAASASAAPDLPAWLRDDTGEIVAEPTRIEPTRPSDWHPADAPKPEPEPVREEPKPQPVISAPMEETSKPKPAPRKPKPATEPKPEPYREPVTTIRGTGMLNMPVDPVLGAARSELSRSNIPGALDAYGKLIKKGKFLDEVIFDLREALYRYPVEVSIWQSLGDAYMRANRLQDALDAYTKAEELLR